MASSLGLRRKIEKRGNWTTTHRNNFNQAALSCHPKAIERKPRQHLLFDQDGDVEVVCADACSGRAAFVRGYFRGTVVVSGAGTCFGEWRVCEGDYSFILSQERQAVHHTLVWYICVSQMPETTENSSKLADTRLWKPRGREKDKERKCQEWS